MRASPLEQLVAADPYLSFLRAVFATLDGVAAERARAAIGDEILVEKLANDKLDAALLDRLEDLPPLFKPAQMEVLTRRRQTYLALNIVRRAEAEEVLASCASAGIQAVALKGLDLAWRVYPDPAQRPCTDIDLLIDPAQLDGAEAILHAAGYLPTPQTLKLRQARSHWMDYQYINPDNDVMFELHVELLHRGRFDLDPAMALGRSIGGFLAPVDRFVHLALHLAKHGYMDRLIWAYDLALLADDTLPQSETAAAAAAAGGRKAMYLALRLVHALFGARLPELEEALAPPRLESWLLEASLSRYYRRHGAFCARAIQLQLFDRYPAAIRYGASRTWRKWSGSKAGW